MTVDGYLKNVDPEKRKQLQRIRALAKKLVPTAEEAIVYGMPTLKYRGKAFLGLRAHKKHIGIYPYSGRVLPEMKSALRGYGFSKGALRIPFGEPIPAALLKQIVRRRLAAIRDEIKNLNN